MGVPVIHVEGLKRRFGELEAVKGISFDVYPGEVFGFLGPNGAGKSTTINMLCVIASYMQTMESFSVVMQFVLMPMFFLSGALFPLKNIPGWLTFLNRLAPVTYGVDPMRQAIMSGMNLPPSVSSQLGLGVQIFGINLSVAAELGIVAVLGVVFVTWAARSFGRQE